MSQLETVLEAAETWMRLVRRHCAAEMDAAACQTPGDFERAHRIEAKADEAREAFERVLIRALRIEDRGLVRECPDCGAGVGTPCFAANGSHTARIV